MADGRGTVEEWQPIEGFEGSYSISSWGRVRSEPRIIVQTNGHTLRKPGRMLTAFPNSTGRLVIRLRRTGEKRHFRAVHVLVAETFLGQRPEHQEVCHNDGDHLNNHVENLRWDTHSANMDDAVRHRTHNKTRRKSCPRGHLLAPPNLSPWQQSRGTRDCLACSRARAFVRARRLRFGETVDLDMEADRRYVELIGQ